MLNQLLTLRFFKTYLSKRFRPIVCQPHTVTTSTGRTLCFDEYLPTRKCLGTVVFTHGMTRSANQDERVLNFAKAMASIGFRMLVPLYPAIQALNVTATTVDDIADSLDYFLSHGFCTNNKVSVFGVSFSGAQAIHAISRPALAPHIAALLALGTAHNYCTTFAKILAKDSEADAYVKILLLRNMVLHSANEYSAALDPVLNAAIDDAYQHNDLHRLAHYGNELPPTLQRHYLMLLHKLIYTDDIFVDYQDTVTQLQTQFELSGSLTTVKTPISLIHSSTDKVLMPSESIALFAALQLNKVRSRLTITPLLDHVNAQFSLRQFAAAWKLLHGFSFFFKHARTR